MSRSWPWSRETERERNGEKKKKKTLKIIKVFVEHPLCLTSHLMLPPRAPAINSAMLLRVGYQIALCSQLHCTLPLLRSLKSAAWGA